MVNVPLPDSHRFAQVVATLALGKPCLVSPAATVAPDDTSLLASYRDELGELQAVWCIPLAIAAYLSAAMAGFPRSRAVECLRDGSLDSSLADAFGEVGNVLGVLVNGPGSPRLRFDYAVSSADLESEARKFCQTAARTAGYAADIDGSGEFTVSVFLS